MTTLPTLPTPEAVRQIIDDLGWPAFWADSVRWSVETPGVDATATLDQPTLIIVYDADGPETVEVTMPQLQAAVYDLSTGKITTDPYQIRSATEYLADNWADYADGDANTADLVVQWAAFGEIVYG